MRIFLYFFIFLAAQISVFSQSEEKSPISTLEYSNPLKQFNAGKFLYYFEDPEGKLDIRDVSRKELQDKFQKNEHEIFLRKPTKSIYWLRLTLSNQSGMDAWMEISSYYLWNIDFYSLEDNEYKLSVSTGSLKPESSKAIGTRFYWFPAEKDKQKTYYFRIQTHRSMEVPIKVGTILSHEKHHDSDFYIAGAFVGLMMGMLFYSLVLYYFFRNNVYLWYAGYIIWAVQGILYINNHIFIHELFGESFVFLWHRYPAAWTSFIFFFVCGFSILFLELEKHNKLLYRITAYSLVTIGLVIPFIIFTKLVPYYIIIHFFSSSVIAGSLGIFLISLYLWRIKKVRHARFYSLGWFWVTASSIIYFFTIDEILPYNLFTRNIYFFGLGLESVFFTLALSDKIYSTQKEMFLKNLNSNQQVFEEKISQREIKLRELSALAEKTSDGVVITDSKGYIKWSNESNRLLTGYSLEESIGKKPGQILQGKNTDLATVERLRKAVHEFRPIREIILNYNKSGHSYWVDLTINPIFNEHGVCENFIAIQRDVTEQIEKNLLIESQNKELIKAKQEAIAASNAKSEFIANMSHEIRTPLTGIIGFADIMKNTLLDETQKTYLSKIHQSSLTLLEIINDILDFSKIQAGKIEIAQSGTNLREIIEQCLDSISYKAESKNLKLITNVDKDLPAYILMDSLHIKQVLMNLLGNAVKFTGEGEIELSVQIKNKKEKHLILIFSVRDTGIGISKEKQKKIFDSFSQEDNSTTREYGGTGLGLTISKRLLELMGSDLELESDKGKGSRFFFQIQTKEIKPIINKEEKKEEQENYSVSPNSEFIVLIVDDTDINRLLIRSMIGNIFPGFKIIEAVNGKEAVDIYEQTHPDLIIMDLQMPEMNGFDATIEIRRIEKAYGRFIPILALSAGTISGEQEKCKEAGMNDFLSKPITTAELKKQILHWIGK